MEEEIKEKTKLSLYLGAEKLRKIEDLRLLLTLDGRNMRSIVDFTSILEGMIYFAYRILKSDRAPIILRGFFKGVKAMDVSEDTQHILIEPTFKYPPLEGYEAKNMIQKAEQKQLIDESIKLINEKGPEYIEIGYSDYIKKILEVITESTSLTTEFFLILYTGNLYHISPTTMAKIFVDLSYEDLTPQEIKQIKYIQSDLDLIFQLVNIRNRLNNTVKIWKKGHEDIMKEMSNSRDNFWSVVSDFNYVDAFYGFVYSKIYLMSGYKSAVSFITDFGLQDHPRVKTWIRWSRSYLIQLRRMRKCSCLLPLCKK